MGREVCVGTLSGHPLEAFCRVLCISSILCLALESKKESPYCGFRLEDWRNMRLKFGIVWLWFGCEFDRGFSGLTLCGIWIG